MANHYKDVISSNSDHVGGFSRNAGDAAADIKNEVISKIIKYGNQYNLSQKDIANLICRPCEIH